ncbi:demethylmenaquinone methyltransferase/2-methoxy-6-polyprenyl-1,4-benzoquinol methylase [Nocardia tenerifensis]|uniref:Demethylmenaquinone methyltransferase/2-methoxy-6-polyprenyl-1,4-benzoquinol methylase n=1 Tax=Nocardia tenerifensis TaxID=228006 RepID=A0A318K285_9NOCA|nr:class I SAM-dependent methyltransferase [Nocardia tenerifensis]PXX65604.1 demethylmenaquinone methyltransferase/2-methoxy-6-polyprenyl-1,4-benzoquinol methylase [Nocardia tenerifensis]
MTKNAPQSSIRQGNHDTETGVLLTKPRSYRTFKALFLLGRGRRLNAALVALSGAATDHSVADIGCGPGDLARALAVRVGPGGRVVGVDPAAEMIDYASAHSRATTNCRFELGSAQTLTLPDASFDVVTSTFAMHHIPEQHRRAAIAQMFRILRPGGTLLLADTHPTGPVLSAVVRIMARFAARRTHDAGPGHHADPVVAVDIRRYRDLLTDVGFGEVAFHTVEPATGVLLATKEIRR